MTRDVHAGPHDSKGVSRPVRDRDKWCSSSPWLQAAGAHSPHIVCVGPVELTAAKEEESVPIDRGLRTHARSPRRVSVVRRTTGLMVKRSTNDEWSPLPILYSLADDPVPAFCMKASEQRYGRRLMVRAERPARAAARMRDKRVVYSTQARPTSSDASLPADAMPYSHSAHFIEAHVYRSGLLFAVTLLWSPVAVRAQTLSLTTANATGDCAGTSFSQMADASGRFLSAGWASPNQFPVGVNRGRARCVVRWNITIPAGYKFVPGGGAGSPTRLANASFLGLRLNGASSRALVESTLSIDGRVSMMAAAMMSGGPSTASMLPLDRAAASPTVESACATPTKTTFQITMTVDVATASDYVIPWPPEPYAEREAAAMGEVRLFYTLAACTTRRSGTGIN